MELRPRHFILLAIVVAIFVFNVIRHRRPQPAATLPAPAPIFTTAVRADTPAWRAFDQAANLRDAPDPQFQPALQHLHDQIAASTADPTAADPTTADPTIADVKGCLTWLEFYRQGLLHPARDIDWKAHSEHHLDGCTKFHLDTTS